MGAGGNRLSNAAFTLWQPLINANVEELLWATAASQSGSRQINANPSLHALYWLYKCINIRMGHLLTKQTRSERYSYCAEAAAGNGAHDSAPAAFNTATAASTTRAQASPPATAP